MTVCPAAGAAPTVACDTSSTPEALPLTERVPACAATIVQANVRDSPPGMSWAGGDPEGSVAAPVPASCKADGTTFRARAPPALCTSIAAVKDWLVLTRTGSAGVISSCTG